MSIHIGTEQQFLSQLVAGLVRAARFTGPRFLQFIKRLFVGVVSIRQFPFVEVVGGDLRRDVVPCPSLVVSFAFGSDTIDEFGVLKNILFGFVVSGFYWIGCFLFCHDHRFYVPPTKFEPDWHFLCRLITYTICMSYGT